MGLLDKFKKNKDEEVNTDDLIKFRKLFEAGKHEEQLVLIEKIFPSKTESYYYSRGNVLSCLGRSQEALESYQTALKMDSKYIKASYRAGQLFFHDEQYAEAENRFLDVIEIEEEDNEIQWSYGAIFHLILIRHHLYQQYKAPEILEARDEGIKILKTHVKFKNGDQDLIEYFQEYFREILDTLEPDIIVEFRVSKNKK